MPEGVEGEGLGTVLGADGGTGESTEVSGFVTSEDGLGNEVAEGGVSTTGEACCVAVEACSTTTFIGGVGRCRKGETGLRITITLGVSTIMALRGASP